jgi:hypothetical protein
MASEARTENARRPGAIPASPLSTKARKAFPVSAAMISVPCLSRNGKSLDRQTTAVAGKAEARPSSYLPRNAG